MNDQVTLKEKTGYFTGAVALNIYWQLFGMFLLYFYTDIFGLAPAAVGTLFLVTRIWDTINDPMCGALTDRTKSRWGSYRPWLLFTVVPFGIFGILCFSTPGLSYTGKLIYAYITYTLVGMGYTALDIPMSTLLGAASTDSMNRTSISVYRTAGSYIGCLIAQGCTLWLVNHLAGGNQQLGFQRTAMVYSILTIVAVLYCFTVTRQRIFITERKHHLGGELKAVVLSPAWLLLFGTMLLLLLSISVRNGSVIYYFKYYIKNETLASLYMVLGSVACLGGTFLVNPVIRRFGKRNIFISMNIIYSAIVLCYCRIPPQNLTWIFILQVLIGIFSGPVFVLLYAMYADIADYIEWKKEIRATGLVYSSGSFSMKFGWTVGGAISGWILAQVGFQANVEQTDRALRGIVWMMSYIPAAFGLMSVLTLAFYPLSEKRVSEISEALRIRKEGSASGSKNSENL